MALPRAISAQEFRFAVGLLSQSRPEFLELASELRPTRKEHGLEQFAVGVPAFATLPSVKKVRLTSVIPRGLRWPLPLK